MKRATILSIILLVTTAVLSSSAPAMIADITSDVETEFGTYHPYPVTITPLLKPYTVASDFSNVSNFTDFRFGEDARSLLQKNHFVATKSDYKQLYDVYKDLKEAGVPVFVAADALLHTFHILYDNMLRILEVDRFAADLDALNRALFAEMKRLYESAQHEHVKEALRKNVAYFAVAMILNNPTVNYGSTLVNAEIALIDAHEGFAFSPIFGYREDYSQYVPRGHYTRNETLQRYFRAMIWYGRIMFRLEPGKSAEDIQKGKDETLQALYIVRAMNTVMVNGEPALTVWDRIYTPTTFFVGKADDLTIYDYTALIEDTYGPDWQMLPLEDLADDTKLTAFIEAAKELRDPSISSSFVWDTEEFEQVTKGFRFMGQRFIPDSYMFQELVYKKVGVQGHSRKFPRGLDVLSVLGSDRAYELLDQLYHETEYENYVEQMSKLKREFDGLLPADWAQNLYWNWLYSLMPLLTEKGEGHPTFMRNQAWTEKELSTALGSWAELRHDTILYAKQSYTTVETAMPIPPGLVQGYVEPNPHLFGRLASLAAFMRDGLDARGLLIGEVQIKLSDLHSLLLSLKTIAEKELTNEEISYKEYSQIASIGVRLEDLVTFSADVSGRIESETDDEMAVIADVHTDPNTSQVLEEGVGYPLNLYVIVKIEGRLVVAQGAMFSYFEFLHPMSDRLTDEAWQQMLKSKQAPELPIWMMSYVEDIADLGISESRRSWAEPSGTTTLALFVTPRQIQPGQSVAVHVFLPPQWQESSAEPVVTLQREDGEAISIPMSRYFEATSPDYLGHIDSEGWEPGEAVIEAVWQNEYGTFTTRRAILVEAATDVEEEQVSCPTAFRLEQNFPNPFNPSTTIRFSVPEVRRGATVELTVYDLLGRKVRTLMDGQLETGMVEVTWDGKDEAGKGGSSGVYFCRIVVDGGKWTKTRKMLLLR